MSVKYQAIVETSDGLYRAVYISGTVIGISEGDRDEVVDFIVLDANEAPTAEFLIHSLIVWVYEMRRGLDIVVAKVSGIHER